MKKILFLVNSDIVIYNFRRELVERLLQSGYEVWISSPYGGRIEKLVAIGCRYLPATISSHGLNPFEDLKLFIYYLKLIHKLKPDMVLTFTIKPTIYGSMACRFLHCPCISNITGLGTGVKKTHLLTWLIKQMYKIALAKNKCIFFQNDDNLDFFIKNKLLKTQYRRIPGSGVNLQHFRYEEYPETDGRLVYVGRIMRDKGIGELLSIIPELVRKYPYFALDIVGSLVDESYTEKINMLETLGKVHYRGPQLDVRPFLKQANAIVLPSYHEGMANVLLEAAATGRPVLASSVPGCRETFDEGVSGRGFAAQDPDDLLRAVESFLALPHERKCHMGKAAREKVEREFDRNIIVDAYMEEIRSH